MGVLYDLGMKLPRLTVYALPDGPHSVIYH